MYRATDAASTCPRCASELQPYDISTFRLGRCAKCGCLYLSRATIEQCVGVEATDEFFALFPPEPPPPPGFKPKQHMPRNCPSCARQLERCLWQETSSVTIDVCPRHGMFFEDGELSYMLIQLVSRSDSLPLSDPS